MPRRLRKQLLDFTAVSLLVLVTACKKNANTSFAAPVHLVYTPDTAIVLNGVSDSSVTPSVDWRGRKGGFSFAAQTTPGITIDHFSGKISWTSSLPIGTYILPVAASNGGLESDTAYYTLTVSGKILTIAGSVQGFAGDGGDAADARFYLPFDVATDEQANLFIADGYNGRIRKITADGIIHTIAGDGSFSFGGDGGPASQAKLSGPSGIMTDGQGDLYVTDYGNNRIRKIDANGIITTVAGSDNFDVVNLGDEGPALQAWLYLLGGKVALDQNGLLYIADYGNDLVRKVTPDGIIHRMTASHGFGDAIPDGTLALDAGIAGPSGLLWHANDLYIVSNLQATVYRLDAGNLYGVAGPTTNQLYQRNLGDGGQATQATFYRPTNVVADRAGNLFIADFNGNRIRKIDTKGVITTIAGNGTPGFSGDGGPAAAAQLNFPYGLAVDAKGDLYIADTYNNRIRKVLLH
jgi:sugar lactone lactonase YvrE